MNMERLCVSSGPMRVGRCEPERVGTQAPDGTELRVLFLLLFCGCGETPWPRELIEESV